MSRKVRLQALRVPATRRAGAAIVLSLLSLGAAGCGSGRSSLPAMGPSSNAAEQIVRELEASAERWNQGDLEGFLLPYLDSPNTTFVGGSGLLRGKPAIEARYRQSYWKAGAPDQTLRFADLEVRMLGPEHALVTGRYRLLDRTGAQAAEGAFSLVFTRVAEGWRIIHDHSS